MTLHETVRPAMENTQPLVAPAAYGQIKVVVSLLDHVRRVVACAAGMPQAGTRRVIIDTGRGRCRSCRTQSAAECEYGRYRQCHYTRRQPRERSANCEQSAANCERLFILPPFHHWSRNAKAVTR